MSETMPPRAASYAEIFLGLPSIPLLTFYPSRVRSATMARHPAMHAYFSLVLPSTVRVSSRQGSPSSMVWGRGPTAGRAPRGVGPPAEGVRP
jgi:hypothetical protein